MFNRIFKKSSALAVSLGLALVMVAPSLAQAKVGLGLGLDAGAQLGVEHNQYGQMVSTQAHLQSNTNAQVGASGAQIAGSAAGQTHADFKNAVDTAREEFLESRQEVHGQFKNTMSEVTEQNGRIGVVRDYVAGLMVAIKTRMAAIRDAVRIFVDAKFGANQMPIADDQEVTVSENSSVDITLTGSDSHNRPLVYMVVDTAIHGTLSGTAPNLTYTPDANFTGSDSFTFEVDNGITTSSLATVSITVSP